MLGSRQHALTRLALLTAGLALSAWSVTSPAFRDLEGAFDTPGLLPLGAAVALLVIASTWGGVWRAPGLWAGLTLLGQAAVLQLTQAGTAVGYQHLMVPDQLLRSPELLAPAGVLVAQAALVVGFGGSALRRFLAGVIPRVGRGWGALALGIFVLTSATLSAEITRYAAEVLWATALQLLCVATLIVAVDRLDDRGAAAARRIGERFFAPKVGTGGDRLPWIAALWVTCLAALLAWFSYQRHPHVPDEVVYLLHARYFAAGLLELPLPPVLDGFDLDLMTVDPDRWFSPVPLGWPALLAVGARFGVPWLVNPVLGGVGVLLAYRALLAVYDRSVARVGVLLMAASPWYVLMCMNFMTHTFTTVAALGALVAAAKARRSRAWGWALLAGVGIGLVSLNRPLEGLIVASLLGPWVLIAGAGSLGGRLLRVVGMASTTALTAATTFPYNRHFTGSASHFPIMDYTDRAYGVGTNAMGFGANRGLGWPGLDPFPGHGLIDVFVNGNLNLFMVNIELFGWALGSLLPILALLALRRCDRRDVGMLIAVFAVVGAHSAYWFSGGPDFGARYWYLILLPCIALSARGLREVARVLPRPEGAGVATVVLLLSSILVFIPWRAVDKYHHYRAMRPDVVDLARNVGFGDALVLIQGNRHPDYASAAVYNPLDLSGPGPIYAWDRSPEVRRRILEVYRERPVWIVAGPTVSGRGFEVLMGPLQAADLLLDPGR